MLCKQCKTERSVVVTIPNKESRKYVLNCGHNEVHTQKSALKALMWDDLMPFQREGINFIHKADKRALIADDMGLGKTVQAIMALKDNPQDFPVLIVVKKRLKYQWAREIMYWLGCPKPEKVRWGRKYHFNANPAYMPCILDTRTKVLPNFKVYICSMDSLHKLSYDIIKAGIQLRTIIVDESHNFKNMGAQRTQALHRLVEYLNIPNRICLSGTPIMNNAHEYFSTLHLINPRQFPSESIFVNNWIHTNVDGKLAGLKKWKRKAFFEETSGIIIRREKKKVMKELPKFTRIAEIVDIEDPDFTKVYKEGVKELQDFLSAHNSRPGNKYLDLLALLAKLRQSCGMAKVPHAIDKVNEYFDSEPEGKIAIGVHHHIVGEQLKMHFANRGADYLIGGLDDRKADAMIAAFQKDPKKQVLVLSTLAAGEGLDGLQNCCSTMIQVERQWNVYKEKQLEGRLDRHGQTQPVEAIYIMVRNSIDEWFHNLIMNKMQWTESALDPDFDGTGESTVNLWDLAEQSARLT